MKYKIAGIQFFCDSVSLYLLLTSFNACLAGFIIVAGQPSRILSSALLLKVGQCDSFKALTLNMYTLL